MVRITGIGTDTLNVSGINAKGILLNIVCTAAVVNTTTTSADLVKSNLSIKAIYSRNGNDLTIFSTFISVLLASLCWLSNCFNTILAADVGHVLLVHGAGVKEVNSWTHFIPFPSIINVLSTDNLRLEVSVNAGFYSANLDPAVSYIEASILSVPVSTHRQGMSSSIDVNSINAASSTYNQSLGNGVVAINFVNLDKITILAADNVVTRCNIAANEVNLSMSNNDLYAVRDSHFPSKALADARNNNLLLYSGHPLNNVVLDLSLTSGNVSASNNFIVVQRISKV